MMGGTDRRGRQLSFFSFNCMARLFGIGAIILASVIHLVGTASAHEKKYLLGSSGKHHPFDLESCLHALEGVRPSKAALEERRQKTAEPDAVTIICNTIDEAWIRNRNLLPPEVEKFDRDNAAKIIEDLMSERQHGLLAIELNEEKPSCDVNDKSVAISGDKIARLLSHDNLLPPYYSGGINFKHLKIADALVLYNETVTVPVAFTSSVFCGGVVDRTAIGLDMKFASIFLSGTTIKKRFLFAASEIRGSVKIASSKFEGAVGFVDIDAINPRVSPVGETNEDQTPKSLPSFVTITRSIFSSEVMVLGGRFQQDVYIDLNVISNLTIGPSQPSSKDGKKNLPMRVQSQFFKPLTVYRNKIENLHISNSTFGHAVLLASNKITGSFSFIENEFYSPSSNDPGAKIHRDIAANQIGTDMYVFFTYAYDLDEINLESNTVNGDAWIYLPSVGIPSGDSDFQPWKGKLNLKNLRTLSELGIRYYQDPSVGSGNPIRTQVCDDVKRPYLTVDLTLVEARVLSWELPIDCDFRWRGVGLRYQHWQNGKAQTTVAENQDDSTVEKREPMVDKSKKEKPLLKWRHVMVEPKVDALTYMAGYLGSRGRLTDSRTVLKEAKERNYDPSEVSLAEDGWWAVFKAWAVYLYLMPGGWGATPERAGLSVLGLWIVGFLFYRFYSVDWKLFRFFEKDWTIGKDQFKSYDSARAELDPDYPGRCSVWRYSLDVTLPVINLHAYDDYYAINPFVRFMAVTHHVAGWVLTTGFLATASLF